MTLILLIAFIGLIVGSLLLLKLSPVDFAGDLARLFHKNKQTIKAKIKEANKMKKVRGIKLLIEETKEILDSANKSDRFTIICISAFSLFVFGIIVAISMDNLFLVPILAAGLSLVPFWYVKFIAIMWKKGLNAELETTLSVITSSYIRTESIITAIDENITYINPPLHDVFKRFLTQTRLINSNMQTALENLKTRVNNDVFREWIDALISCQEDVKLKSTLTSIVSKLSDMRIVSGELDNLLFEPIKEYITMAILLISNVPLMYFLNKSWYETLMFSPIGKVVLAICSLVLFISLAAVIRLSKSIEYRR